MVKTKNKKNNSYMVFLIIFTIILFLFLLIQWRYHKKDNELENWEKISLSPEYIAESQKNTKITPENLLD